MNICKATPVSTTCPLCLRVGGVQWRACGLGGECLPDALLTCRSCFVTNMRRIGHDETSEYLAPVLASKSRQRAKRSETFQARVRETYYGQTLVSSHQTQATGPATPKMGGKPENGPGGPADARGPESLSWEGYLTLDATGNTWEAVYARYGYRLPSSPYRDEPLPVYRPRASTRGVINKRDGQGPNSTTQRTRASTQHAA